MKAVEISKPWRIHIKLKVGMKKKALKILKVRHHKLTFTFHSFYIYIFYNDIIHVSLDYEFCIASNKNKNSADSNKQK